MEHRTNKRIEMQLDVKLIKSGEELGDAVTSNISRQGAFIYLPYHRQPLSNFLTLKILPDGMAVKESLINCLVVRRSVQGMAVMFERDLTELVEIVAKSRLVKEPKPRGSRRLENEV